MTNIKVKGKLKVTLIDGLGRIKEERDLGENLIVTTGKNGIADQLIASPTIPKPQYIGIGAGTVAPTLADTALGSQLGTRDSLDSKTRSNNVVTMVASFAAGNGTGAVTEAGVFDAATAGNMYSRITFAAINKGASDTLQLTWTYTIG